MLDLSAAFDTIEHSILLEPLLTSFGIDGLPFKLVKSHLSNRQQKVKIDDNFSDVLLYGVPKGSFLGPLYFTMYTYTLTGVIDDHKLLYHIYADDTQLYCSRPSDEINSLLDKFPCVPMMSTCECQQINLK